MPFFSVVIPLYNKELFIQNTISSVLNQSFQDFEIIIVNDGSTDGSMECVSTFKDKRIQVINKENEGVSTARNLGIKSSKGDFIAFLDADDIWYPNHLEDLKNLIESFPECGLYCTSYETSYYNKKIVKPKFLGIDSSFEGIVPDYFTSSSIDSIAWTSAVVIPKSIFEKHGYFNYNLICGEDTEFWIRIALKEKVAFTNEISAKRVISNSDNHLSLSNKKNYIMQVIEEFKGHEKTNENFKKYLDVNRFAIAIERKMNGDKKSFKTIIKDIDYSNLNSKQKTILKLPSTILKKLKQLQVFLIKNKVYLSAFR